MDDDESLDRFEQLICDLEGVETSESIRKRELAKVIASQVQDEVRILEIDGSVSPPDFTKILDSLNETGFFTTPFFLSPEAWEDITNENE